MLLTGNCYKECRHGSIPYGTNQPGPTIYYAMTSPEGGDQMAIGSQLSQTAHFALQLPFITFGLGRNWNFIDDMTAGIPDNSTYRRVHGRVVNGSFTASKTTRLTMTFNQIIPNSQLVIIPYPITQPTSWVTKLSITPSRGMLLTAGALIATCLFVGALIVILHIREKNIDRKEKMQQPHRFHFDAM